ncbi:hypothetical protein [Timonella sp. A28]|uniref:hypothetical protein n=1 Tax=Timonella sp. A28 TaxID=3442640 RepID=UPI003EB83430
MSRKRVDEHRLRGRHGLSGGLLRLRKGTHHTLASAIAVAVTLSFVPVAAQASNVVEPSPASSEATQDPATKANTDTSSKSESAAPETPTPTPTPVETKDPEPKKAEADPEPAVEEKTDTSKKDSSEPASEEPAAPEPKSTEKKSDSAKSAAPTETEEEEPSAPPAEETTNVRIVKTVDGKAIKQGFDFEAVKLSGGEFVAATKHSTDGKGEAGVFTVKAEVGASSTLTFQESLNGHGSLEKGDYPLASAQCYWGKTFEGRGEALSTSVLSSNSFSLDITVLDDKNKQDVVCAVDNTFKSKTPKDGGIEPRGLGLGTIQIQKRLHTLEDTYEPQAGVEFTAVAAAPETILTPTSVTTDASGNAPLIEADLLLLETQDTVTITEVVGAGYEIESVDCEGQPVAVTNNSWEVLVENGSSITCLVTNAELAPTANLTLTKVVDNDAFEGLDASDFTLVATHEGVPVIEEAPSAGSTGSTATVEVPVGDITLSEGTDPSYVASDWTCTGASGPVVGGDVITVAEGENVECTITNTLLTGTLQLAKTVETRPNDNTTASSFRLRAQWDGSAGYAIDDIPSQNVSGNGQYATTAATTVGVGAYQLSELMWNGNPVLSTAYLVSDWTCANDQGPVPVVDGIVQVVEGANVVCSITNTAREAEQTTNITIQKLLDGVPAQQGFEFAGSAVNENDDFLPISPTSHTTDGNGRAGKFTVKTAVDEVVVATFNETLFEHPNAPDGPLVIDSVQCWYSGPNATEKIEEIPGVVVNAERTGFTVTIPQYDENNKQEVLCDVDNVPPAGELTLVKNVINDNGGTALAEDFRLAADGPSSINEMASQNPQNGGLTGSTTTTVVEAGVYSLSESGPDGYTASEWSCEGGTQDGATVTIAHADVVVCSITNDDEQGDLTLVKNVINDNGGTALAEDFTLIADGPTPISETASQNQQNAGLTGSTTTTAVDAGAYTLSESGPDGYAASDWSCDGGTLEQGVVTIGNAESVVCTITNDDEQGELTLVKNVINDNGGTALAGQFTLIADGPTPISETATYNVGNNGLTGSTTPTAVDAGAYTLSESGPDGYAASDWSCEGGTLEQGVVTVANGEVVVCEITNDDEQGELTLIKNVINDNGGTALAEDFTLMADGPTPIDEAASQNPQNGGLTGSTTPMAVDAGAYILSEDGPFGYEPSDWSCEGGDLVDGVVTVPNGGTVVCEITNDDIPAQLRLVKTVVNDHGGSSVASDFTLVAAPSGGGTAVIDDEPTFDAMGSPADPNALVAFTQWADADAGSYDLSESEVPGYPPTGDGWICFDGEDPLQVTPTEAGATVDLTIGQVVTCGIINDDIKSNLFIDKVKTGDAELIGNDKFRVSYDVTVASDGVNPRTYTLTDDFGLSPDAVIDSVEVVGPEGVTLNDNFDGVGDTTIATDVVIANMATHVYTVTYEFTIPKEYRYDFIRECEGEGGAPNTATYTADQDSDSASDCANIPEPVVVDLGLDKEAVIPGGGDAIEVGDSFLYKLAVTNHGETTAYELVVTDTLPDFITVDTDSIVLPVGWTLVSNEDGKIVFASDEQGLAPEGTLEISFMVTYDPPVEEEGEFINSFDPVENTACVESGYEDTNEENNCGTTTVVVKQIDPNAEIACYADAQYLEYYVEAENFTLEPGQILTMKWFALEGAEPLATYSFPVADDGTLEGTVLWPGTEVNEDGIAIQWPGMRPAGPGETPTWQNMVIDPTLDSYKFREPMRIEFTVNPGATVVVVYPEVIAEDCLVDRTADLILEKTASVETVNPGVDYTYLLSAHNDGLGTLTDVTITDTIPDDVAVTDITYNELVFPTWENCEITGDSDGYGGELTCSLNGVLGPESAAPDILLTANVRPGAQIGEVVNTAEICGTMTDQYEGQEECADDDATVAVTSTGTLPDVIENPVNPVVVTKAVSGTLAQTGTDLGLAYLASFLMLVGLITVLTARGRRGHEN